jgi:hypothetical protein
MTHTLGRYAYDIRIDVAADGYGYTIDSGRGRYLLIAGDGLWWLQAAAGTGPCGTCPDVELLLHELLGDPQLPDRVGDVLRGGR